MYVSDRDILVFTKNIAVMIRASIPLAQAVKSQAEQTQNNSFRRVLWNVAREIETGQKFSSAIEKYPSLFNSFYVNVVRAAEKTGMLEHNCEYLAEHIEAHMLFKKTLRSALIYPGFMLSAIIAVAIIFGYSVLPTITELLVSFSVTPPLSTKIVLVLLLGMQKYGILIVLGVTSVLLCGYAYAQTKQGRLVASHLIFYIPVLGGVFHRVYLAQSAKILATLLKSGIAVH